MKTILFVLSLLLFTLSPARAQDVSIDTIQTILVAQQQATIASPVSGLIVKLPYYEGDVFKQGDILAAYDCAIQKARHEQAQARYEAASGLLEARKKLNELNTVSKLEMLKAQAESKQAKAEVEEYAVQIDRCTITAPFDGRITEKRANPYETTEAGQPLLSIASLDKLHAKLLVPSKWLSWIKVGAPLEVQVQENGQRYGAHIIRIGGAVDPVSQSIQLIAELDEQREELLPGMSGTAHFETPVQ